jgi:MoaA/NifB/PqqE/SkfB family radical SAM enzyme
MELKFDKLVVGDKYFILFNSKTGLQIIQGLNGNPDPKVLEFPSLLDIGIMGHCNNNCNFCYQGSKKENHMSLDNFKKIIDEVKDHTPQVALGGRGDPNKHPKFKEILEYCRKNKVVPNYSTSGKGLTEKEVEISKLCGAVAVSDYDKPFTYTAINKFTNSGILTNIHTIFTYQNYEKLANLLSGNNPWKGKLDIKQINAVVILLFKPQGKGKDMTQLIPTPEQISVISELLFVKDVKTKVGVDSCFANHIMNNVSKEILDEYKPILRSCEASRFAMYISPSMNALPCSFANSKFEVGITSSIADIWNKSGPFLHVRERLEKNETKCPVFF